MRKTVARVGLAAAVALATLGVGGGAGAAPTGCAATAPAQVPGIPGGTTPMKCSYKATGTQGGYFAATPNPWKITITRKVGRKVKVVQTIKGDPAAGSVPGGQMTLKIGDTVTATIMPACAPPYGPQACGAAGFIGVGNA